MAFPSYCPDLITDDLRDEILRVAETVVVECPYAHDLSADDLVGLTFLQAAGKYIPVDVQDRVAGRMLHSMIRQVIGRISFKHYTARQISEHIAMLAPRRALRAELRAYDHVCDAASAMTGRFLDPHELAPLPLPGCWGNSCFCYYTAKQIEEGPSPAEHATFSGIEEIEEEEDE